MSENVTIRHMKPTDNIRLIARGLRDVLEKNPKDRFGEVLVGPSVQRLILGWCEQLCIDADHLEKGDNREGVIPEEH